jgi:hypothetical protein
MKKNGLLWRIFNLFKPSGEPPAPQAPTPAPPTPTEPPAPTQKTETHKVAGVSFRQDIIEALAVENDDYSKTKKELIEDGLTDEWVNEYDFYPGNVELVPEPDNPQDPKAIKVVAGGHHIGYIKAGSCAHIRKLLKSGKILTMSCEIGGGRSKIVREDVDEWGKSSYSLEKSDIPFYAKLSIVVEL